MSTDSSHLLSNNQSVTSDMLYNLKPSCSNAQSYRLSLSPVNKSVFSPSDTMIFQIPCGRKNSYLNAKDSYLKICVLNNDNSGNTLYYDKIGYSVINQVTTYHCGNMIEKQSGFNAWASYLSDFQYNQSSSLGASAMLGIAPQISESVYNTISGSLPNTQTVIGGITASLASLRAGFPIPPNGGRSTICLPLLLNTFNYCDKMLPLGRMFGGDLDLQFLLESQNVGMVSNPNAFNSSYVYSAAYPQQWAIISAELELSIIVLSDNSEEIVKSMSPYDGSVYIHSTSVRYNPQTYVGGSSGWQTFKKFTFITSKINRNYKRYILQCKQSYKSKFNFKVLAGWSG